MIMYFGVGGNIKDYEGILSDCGVQHVLYSYANLATNPFHPDMFEDVFIDSGAFSAASQGTKIRVENYICWLKAYLPLHPSIKTYANLDDIGDPKKSMQNQKLMEDNDLKPLPCYHYGEEPSILKYYCDKYEYVALGGIVSKRAAGEDIQTWWEYIYRQYPDNKFHIFGCNNLLLFVRYQPYSIDSVSHIQFMRHFQLPGYYGGLPNTLDISENGSGWRFPIYWKDFAPIIIKTMMDWEKMEWVKHIKEHKVKDSPQMKLL